MRGNWTGGVVDRRDDGPPTVDEWRPIADDERSAALADAAAPIAYRTTVGDPRENDDQRALLELRGAGPQAEIWLDGDRIGRRDGRFGPFRTPFEPRPESELIVVDDRPAWAATAASEPVTADLAVDVEARPRTFCRRLEARSRLTDDGGVIDVEIEVDAGRAVDDAITLSVRPEGFRGGATMQRVPVEADAGDRVTVTQSLEIREPSLWWPNGVGPQHRYSVQAKVGADAVTTTTAFRTVDRDGDDLLVNGERVHPRGFTRAVGGNPVADVRRAAAANANLLRVRGHVPSASFYAACDEAGVLVWQDLPTDGVAADDEGNSTPDTDRVQRLVNALEDAYGTRPSLALYGLDNGEPDASGAVDGLHGSGALTKLRFRYRTWRTDAGGESNEAVADAVGEVQPIVSSVGPPGSDADATALFPGWRYLEAADVEWILERYPELGRLVGAFGAGSLATDADPADVPGLDAAILETRLGTDPDPERSRRYQARTLATVAEGLRRHGSTLLAAETLRDTAVGGGMGVLTASGDEKPAYGAIARSFEPVQAILDGPPEPGTVGISLCNDTRDALEATVAWTAGDAEGEATANPGAFETVDAGAVEIPPDADRVRLTVAADDRTVTNAYRL